MKKVILFIWLLAFNISDGFSQNIQRKAWLGVQFENISENDVQKLKLLSAKGVKVLQVLPASTAESIGIEMNDVIVLMNGNAINEISDVIYNVRSFNPGENLEVVVYRNGKRKTLKGKILARPYENAGTGEVIYGEMAFREGYIRTILNKPEGEGPFPTVFYLQGYTCQSIDNVHSTHYLRPFIDGLLAKGYAIFRMEKPGVGDSKGLPDCRGINYETEIGAFSQGLAFLQNIDYIHNDNIFLFGHSLGGIAAPLMVEDHKPRGIIVYGTVMKSWAEYLMDIAREQRQMLGMEFLKIEEDARRLFPLLNDYLVQKQSPAELLKVPGYEGLLSSFLGFDGESLILDRHYSFWQQLQDRNLTEAWKNAGVHTFAIYGEADIQAINHKGHETIAAIVNSYHPGKGNFMLLPRTDHGMLEVGNMEENLQLSHEERSKKQFNFHLLSIIDEWMQDKIQHAD